MESEEKKHRRVEDSIYQTLGGSYKVEKSVRGKLMYFGTYKEIEDAREIRDALVEKFGHNQGRQWRRGAGKDYFLKKISEL